MGVGDIRVAAIQASASGAADEGVVWLPKFNKVAKVGRPEGVFPSVGTTPPKCGCRRCECRMSAE